MAANMPMAGNGQLMMQQQQQSQHVRQMPSGTQVQTAMYQSILASQSAAPQGGWQSSLPIQDRLTKAMSL